jgi:ATP-dependent Clp protease protease subunit
LTVSQVNKAPKVSLSFQQRKVFIYDDIDEESSFEFVNCINKLIFLDEKIGEKKPVEILINSGGGIVYYGLTIISTIEQLKKMGYEVTTTNIGICASMAFVISVCGSKRECYEHSVYMYHDISSGSYGKLQTMKEDIQDLQKLKDMVDNIVIKYTNITEEDINNWCMRKLDRYFYLPEALELKISDFVK